MIEVEESEFIKKWRDEIFILGNHHAYGLFKETYESVGNRLICESIEFLKQSDISEKTKMYIKLWQFWLLGFLSGQNIPIYDNNVIKMDDL